MAPDTSLRERRAALLAQSDLKGDDFCRAYAAEADEWLSGVAERAVGENNRHLALLAVGGYGRSSLCPYSDLDVVLLHSGRRDIKAVADAIWYPVWDEGVRLDHSVRRPSEVLEMAAEDVRVALGLLDARLVWGDPKVADPLLVNARNAWRDSLGTRYLTDLRAQMAERHSGSGDVAFLLEPDLKESHGGLRDVNVLRAISAFAPLLADYADLGSLEQATSVLTRIRVELHRIARREQDKLLLQDQDQIASALAFEDADALMAAVSTAGRQIAWVSDDVWRRRKLWDPSPKPRRRLRRSEERSGKDGRDSPIALGPDMVDVGGEIALLPTAAVSEDTSLAFRLAATAAELDQPIAKGSLHRLADRMPPPSDPWDPELLAALIRLLAVGHAATDKLESLDQHGLLARIIPEWAAVRNKPQRNAYHTYTVDRHLLEAAAVASELTDSVERPDLLLIGALLHDIGKGFPGDHTTVGMEIVREHRDPHGLRGSRRRDTGRPGAPSPPSARHRHASRPRRSHHGGQRRPGGGKSGDAASSRRPDRSGQPGHGTLGLGAVEGRVSGRTGPAGRPRARRRDATQRTSAHSGGVPSLDGRSAQRADSRRCPSIRRRWSWPPPTAPASSPTSPARWHCTAWTCARPT